MKICIRKATESDLTQVSRLYDDVCDDLAATDNYPCWEKGIYPSEKTAADAIREEAMYVAVDGETVVGSLILRHQPEQGYDQVRWMTEDDYDNIYVLYTLAVHPAYKRNGIGKELMEFAECKATVEHCISLRLDIVTGNIPAERLYRTLGYQYIDTVSLGYEDCGIPLFDLFEKPL